MPSTPRKSVLGYGRKVRYTKGQLLDFADFALRFDGQTHIKVKEYPRGFVYENFTATAKGKSQKIKWSMGTGELAPAGFSIADEDYLLELKSSDILGNLQENELIVWRAKDWQKQRDELHPTTR